MHSQTIDEQRHNAHACTHTQTHTSILKHTKRPRKLNSVPSANLQTQQPHRSREVRASLLKATCCICRLIKISNSTGPNCPQHRPSTNKRRWAKHLFRLALSISFFSSLSNRLYPPTLRDQINLICLSRRHVHIPRLGVLHTLYWFTSYV
jgi:hypothetical protein